jgi:carboxyl-terminal processing protease
MFKRVLLAAAAALPLGLLLVLGLQLVDGHNPFASEADRKAAQFEEVVRLIHQHYVREDGTDYTKLTEAALDGMLRALDPHSEFMSLHRFSSFREDTSGEFGGIGVHIEMRDRRLTVVAPMGGTPGERAGLLRGDQFMKVDGTDMVDLSLDECLKLLRGKPGTTVVATVYRPRTGETIEKTIVREVIKVESVRDARMVAPGIGSVRIVQFGQKTSDEFLSALEALELQGMKALVLDLRDNPGGLLNVAVDVAQPFFKEGELVVYTQGRSAETREDIVAQPKGPRRTYPIAVLINSGSASASEIVAGALRDTGRAVLIGEKSFGKGSVQTILPVRDGGAVRLTTALYYVPSGAVINGKGIEPHIPVTLSADEDRKLAIQRNRLPMLSPEEFREQFEFDPIEDRQMSAAVDALRGVFAFSKLAQAAEGTTDPH